MTANRLLLIEDDYDVAEMLGAYFETFEYAVFHADSGEQGIEMARLNFPNLILLDIGLPDMDGYDICRRLRHMVLTKYIPIIFLTQKDQRANRVKGLELGADDYVTKPFDLDELRLRVQGSIHRATREHLHEPRTGLPTGPLIEDELTRHHELHKQGEELVELIFNLDTLTAYRDVYGFLAADEALGFAAKCIREGVSMKGTPNDFIGIMDDHFIVLTYCESPDKLEKQISEQFNGGIKAFYTFNDADRGGILLHEDSERERIVPLMQFQTLKTSV